MGVPRQMRLGVFVQAPGNHVGGWRRPDAVTGDWPNLALMQHIAAAAERGRFDMFFLGDGYATGYGEHPATIGKFEPLTLLVAMARREGLSLRDLYFRVAAARGHLLVVATAGATADRMADWFAAGAADGFNVMPPFFAGQFDAFIDGVVPLLQERGLFRTDYAGETLRDHLGLARVPDRRQAAALVR